MSNIKIYIGYSFKKEPQAAAENSVNIGGYGVVITSDGHVIKELSAGYTCTSEARLNLYALIVSLKIIDDSSSITAFIPNGYIEDSLSLHHVDRWFQRGTISTKKNSDLWKTLYPLITNRKAEIRNKRINDVKISWEAARAKDLSRIAYDNDAKEVDLNNTAFNQWSLFDSL